MSASTQSALFFPHFAEPLLTTLLPLALAARERRGIEPVVVLRTPDEAAISRLDAERMQYRILPQELAEDGEVGSVPGPLDVGSVFGWISKQRQHIKRGSREAQAILDTYSPSAVFQTTDSGVIESFVNRLANQRGVPTVLVQWAATGQKEFYNRLHRDGYSRRIGTTSSVTRRVLLARRAVGLGVLRAMYRLDGIRRPRFLGDGNARWFAVMNRGAMDMFRQQGVPARKLVSTGHPEDDLLYAYRERFAGAGERAATAREFGLDLTKRIIVYAREAIEHYGWLSRATDHNIMRTVLRAATGQENAQVVLKLHPRDSVDYYQWVAAEFPMVVQIHQCDFYRLIAISDVYLSQASSTTRWAVQLSKPVILLGMAHLEVTNMVAQQLGLTPVSSAEALNSALQQALSDGSVPESQQVKELRSQVDGKAIDRILDLAGLPKISQGESSAVGTHPEIVGSPTEVQGNG